MLAGVVAGTIGTARFLAIPAAIFLAAAIGGCGNSGTGGTTEVSSAMARARFAQRLGDICQVHTDRQVVAIERFETQHGIPLGKANRAQLERELRLVILPIVEDTIHDAGRLRPPAELKAEFEAFIGSLESGVAESKRDPSWVATGETEPFMHARKTSAALGTYYCGQA
jgi:hypothetical protein